MVHPQNKTDYANAMNDLLNYGYRCYEGGRPCEWSARYSLNEFIKSRTYQGVFGRYYDTTYVYGYRPTDKCSKLVGWGEWERRKIVIATLVNDHEFEVYLNDDGAHNMTVTAFTKEKYYALQREIKENRQRLRDISDIIDRNRSRANSKEQNQSHFEQLQHECSIEGPSRQGFLYKWIGEEGPCETLERLYGKEPIPSSGDGPITDSYMHPHEI